MKTVSLHSRLLLASIVPTTLFMTIFSIILILFRFQDIDSLKSESAEILLGKYALAIASKPETSAWSAITQTALEEKYISAIEIFDGQGHSLAHAGPKFHYQLSPQQLTVPNPANSVIHFSNNNGELFVQPIISPNNSLSRHWLAIELRPSAFTIARYEAIIGVSITAFGLITILMLLISGGIRRWLEPIHRMMLQLQSIDSHHLNKRINSKAVGDLALLEGVVNDLLTQIEKEHEELQQSIEQANSDLNENLETMEVQNIELRMARNEAIEGNRIKSAFLANISHELRTPLNSINGFTQLLLKMSLPNKQRDCVETIQKSSNNLLAIINDVLDFSKIEAGKFSLEKQPLLIEDVVFDVLESLSPQAEQKNLEQIAFIYDDVPKKIIGDSLRLKQVLTNLVSNAIKFTHQGEVVVRVMLEDSRPKHHLIRVSITDTGIGLSVAAKNDLFTAFQQGNPSVSRQFGGTGLGLVISKNIVKLMEGEISFDTQQEKGSTFWFTFKAGICADDTDSEISLAQKQIIALEPHEKSAQLLKATLFRAQADINIVKDWDSLLRSLTTDSQVVILNNRALAEMKEQLEQLRKRFKGMIVLYSSLSDQHLDEADIVNLQLYSLTKPIRPRTLLRLLAQGFLTAKLATTPHTITTGQTTPPPINLHILAVDDHPLNLKLVCTLLEDLGIQVSQATNGREAVELAQQQHFDLIFMDIQMPEMSGLEATKLIRQHEKDGQCVPIIALTAHALSDEKELMLQQGMNDYLTKPLQETQLIYMIEHWTSMMLSGQHHHPEQIMVTNEIGTSQLPLVDQQECVRLAAGKTDLAEDMLNMLLNGLAAQREKIINSRQDHNFPALLAHTHYLHGATRYCGVPRLRAAANTLETQLKNALKNNLSIIDMASELANDIDELIAVIDDLMIWRVSSHGQTDDGLLAQ